MKEAVKDWGSLALIVGSVLGFVERQLKKSPLWARFIVCILIILLGFVGAFFFFRANPRTLPSEYSFLVRTLYAEETTFWIYGGKCDLSKKEIWFLEDKKVYSGIQRNPVIKEGDEIYTIEDLPLRKSLPEFSLFKRGFVAGKQVGTLRKGEKVKILEIVIVNEERIWLKIKKGGE